MTDFRVDEPEEDVELLRNELRSIIAASPSEDALADRRQVVSDG